MIGVTLNIWQKWKTSTEKSSSRKMPKTAWDLFMLKIRYKPSAPHF